MSRPTRAGVSVGALAHNLAQVRRFAPGSRVWAVVKANAYGHGLAAALRGFASADGLALLEFDYAQRLREAGWNRPVLMIEGPFGPDDVALARRLSLSLVVHRPEQLDWIAEVAGHGTLHLVLKLNSGMNRLGLRDESLRAAFERASRLPGVASVGLMTHFANADLPGGAVDALAMFRRATDGLAGERSLANSAAIVDLPQAHADWVRPGIMLYGASPFADRSAASIGLRPAMTLASALIAVQSLAPGEALGYGSTFVAPTAMRVGIVACGYADGYPRHAPTGTPIAVDGVRTRTLGRVAMDMLTVDLGPVPDADPGTPVELWGATVPVDEVAAAAGTIGYELLCAVAPRVPLEIVD